MRGELTVSISLLYSFLLVVGRVGGVFIFVPLPNTRNAPDPIRIVLTLAVTLALYPVWPTVAPDIGPLELCGLLLIEGAFGVCMGLFVSFLSEAGVLFGQICGLQAGFSFASTIDPESQADSPVLSAIAQSVSSLLFVTLGLHRYLIRVFAESLQRVPPGKLVIDRAWGQIVLEAAGSLFSVGLRLALPIVGLMLMVDLTLALLSRINSQLQLITMAMPLKILAALATICVLLMIFPSVYSGYADQLFRAMTHLAR